MSEAAMTDNLIEEAATQLFADLATPALVNEAEAGTWPDALWQAVEAAGFLDALVGELPGDLTGFADAVVILRVAARYAVPLPLAETILARFALNAAGLPIPAGPLALLPVEADDIVELHREAGGWRLFGKAR